MLGKWRRSLEQLLVPLLLGIGIVCSGSEAWAQAQPSTIDLSVVWGQRKSFPMGTTFVFINDVQVSDPTVCDVQAATQGSTQSLVVTGKQLGVATVLLKKSGATEATEYRILVTLDKKRVDGILAMLKLDQVTSQLTPDGDKVVLDGYASDEATVQTAIRLIVGPRFPEAAIVNRVSVYWPYSTPTYCAGAGCHWRRW